MTRILCTKISWKETTKIGNLKWSIFSVQYYINKKNVIFLIESAPKYRKRTKGRQTSDSKIVVWHWLGRIELMTNFSSSYWWIHDCKNNPDTRINMIQKTNASLWKTNEGLLVYVLSRKKSKHRQGRTKFWQPITRNSSIWLKFNVARAA